MDKTIDLATLDTGVNANQGVELELEHPKTGEPMGIFITVAGRDSKVWRRAIGDIADRNKSRTRTPDMVYREDIELTARCTLGWRNMVVDGQPLDFSFANAKAIYERFAWIKEQADNFKDNRANFLPA